MSFGRLDGRGYKISNRSTNDSLNVMGSGLSNPDGGDKAAINLATAPANSAERASVSSDIEHFRAAAASAELQKKSTDLLLRSEQQKNRRLNVALEELKQRLKELEEEKEENTRLKQSISNKDNQLVQKALQLDQQRKESEEQKEENTRLEQLISNKENQLIQKALENETMASERKNSLRTLHKLSERNETLAAIAEELSINFAQNNIKYSALEKDRSTAEAKATDLSRINRELQSSTNTLQLAFEDNLQALDALRFENSELKSKLQLTNATDHNNDRKEQLIAKLHQRRALLELVKAARSAAERKAKVFANEGTSGFTTAEQVEANWDSYVQSNDAIVTVLRKGSWVEAINLKKKDTSLNWVEYCCDGVTEAVPEGKIRRTRKQPCYFESPPTPPNPKRKRSKGAKELSHWCRVGCRLQLENVL